MKAILSVLVWAVLGLAVQNYQLSKKVGRMDGYLRREAASPAAPAGNTFSAELEVLGQSEARDAAHREEMDSLSNALSDRGIIWHPSN